MPFSLWDENSDVSTCFEIRNFVHRRERCNAERVILRMDLSGRNLKPTNARPLNGCSSVLQSAHPGPMCPRQLGSNESSTKDQMCAVVAAVSELAHVRRVNFLPAAIVVELEDGDGREYLRKSLPGIVANRATTYHHGTESFLTLVRNHARERILDPTRYFQGPLPQDDTEYINEPNWGILSPGIRVSTRAYEAVLSTTSEIILRKGGDRYATVANHGFTNAQEVSHLLHLDKR